MVSHAFAVQQRADDSCAFAEPGIPLRLGWPGYPGDVFIQPLPASKREPKTSREHLAKRCGSLCDDRWMVTVAWGRDDAERQRGRLHGCAKPRPGISGMALSRPPGFEVV